MTMTVEHDPNGDLPTSSKSSRAKLDRGVTLMIVLNMYNKLLFSVDRKHER